MKIIKIIVEQIEDEVNASEDYAKLATQYKTEDKALADMYFEIANQELMHVDKLHSQVVRYIQQQKASGKETPVGMKELWDWQHAKIIDNVARIKVMLDMYKK